MALKPSACKLLSRQLSEMVQGLNDVSREQLRKFDEQLTLATVAELRVEAHEIP